MSPGSSIRYRDTNEIESATVSVSGKRIYAAGNVSLEYITCTYNLVKAIILCISLDTYMHLYI